MTFSDEDQSWLDLPDAEPTEVTYKIVRHFQRGDNEVIRTGLTLSDARAHCNSPETSSSTTHNPALLRLTAERGPWFDGYDEEHPDMAERARVDARQREGIATLQRLLGG